MPRDVIVCSFHTPDDYYAGHARELRDRLDSLGLAHEIWEVQKPAGTDWADITRRKIGFIREICHKHPDKMVVWIDVDCRITHLPDYIRESSADFVGFQRSFGSPLHIGYERRSRFWEPSFWGLNATPQARQLIEDAYALEQRADLKATDDYFLEEAWRANADLLTFQLIPTTALIRERSMLRPGVHPPFFQFGSSGNVAEFKDKVVQHGARRGTGIKDLRRKGLQQAKNLERALPENLSKPLRRLADNTGVTGILTQGRAAAVDRERAHMLGQILSAGMEGRREDYEREMAAFDNRYIPKHGELGTFAAAEAFMHYASRPSEDLLRLAWWAKPFPGNFGDWLSPLVVGHHTDARIVLQSPVKAAHRPHMFGLGSIGRFIKPRSVVVGTGISSEDVQLSRKAHYISVRGPITAKVLRASGGPAIDSFGDPGLLMSRIIPVTRGATNGRLALVRHFTHTALPLRLPEHVDEVNVLVSRPQDIADFIGTLARYDAVITSAMHVMIVCQSYGIPCGLVTFEGSEDAVHGTGIKYADYAMGAGVEVMDPQVIGLDLSRRDLQALVRDIRVPESSKDEVEGHIRRGITRVLAR